MISHTFTGHHWPGLKAIIACTLKATDDISACAVAAGIADVIGHTPALEQQARGICLHSTSSWDSWYCSTHRGCTHTGRPVG